MKNLLAALALLLTLGLASCGGGGPAGTYSIDTDKMVESMKSTMLKSMPAEQQDKVAKMVKDNAKGELKINADSTWSMHVAMEMMGQKQETKVTGTWKLDGDKIKLTGKEEGKDKEETVEGTIKDKTLTMSKNGMTMQFNRK